METGKRRRLGLGCAWLRDEVPVCAVLRGVPVHRQWEVHEQCPKEIVQGAAEVRVHVCCQLGHVPHGLVGRAHGVAGHEVEVCGEMLDVVLACAHGSDLKVVRWAEDGRARNHVLVQR